MGRDEHTEWVEGGDLSCRLRWDGRVYRITMFGTDDGEVDLGWAFGFDRAKWRARHAMDHENWDKLQARTRDGRW